MQIENATDENTTTAEATRAAEMARIMASLDELPAFVDMVTWDPAQEGIPPGLFWSVQETGDLAADVQRGEQFAIDALAYSRKFNLPILLGRALESMILQGRVGPVECGFIGKLAETAQCGAHH
jgi:hypothetical protein